MSGVQSVTKCTDSLGVLCEPDSREVTPAEFPDDLITTIGEDVADVNRVVSALDVVLPVFLVFSHDGVRVRRVV